MVDNRKERYITKSIEPISLKQTEKILDQMNNSICRINQRKRNISIRLNNDKKIKTKMKGIKKRKMMKILIQ